MLSLLLTTLQKCHVMTGRDCPRWEKIVKDRKKTPAKVSLKFNHQDIKVKSFSLEIIFVTYLICYILNNLLFVSRRKNRPMQFWDYWTYSTERLHACYNLTVSTSKVLVKIQTNGRKKEDNWEFLDIENMNRNLYICSGNFFLSHSHYFWAFHAA